jgi:hypothetical protein
LAKGLTELRKEKEEGEKGRRKRGRRKRDAAQ